MCWETSNVKDTDIRVATCDITCYKVLKIVKEGRFGKMFPRLIYRSYFQKFDYKVGRKYRMKNGHSLIVKQKTYNFSNLLYYQVNEGFHSYSSSKKILDIRFSYLSVDTPSNLKNTMNTYIVKCIIPTGSHYLEDDFGNMVSDSIKLTDEFIGLLNTTGYSPMNNIHQTLDDVFKLVLEGKHEKD